MTLVEGDELQRLWSLISELSSQLAANRELCTSLQQQADSLKVSLTCTVSIPFTWVPDTRGSSFP